MFLAKMVSGLICSKNNKKKKQSSAPAKSPKSKKKNEKCKGSLSKSHSKLSLSELLRSKAKDKKAKEARSDNHSSKSNKSSNNSHGSSNNNHNNRSLNHNHSKNVKACVKPCVKPPAKPCLKPCVKLATKVTSSDRTDNRIDSCSTIAGKKAKSLRKRSPNWLKFTNSPLKIAEQVTYMGTTNTTSACRPGTLYSDVLFGAGASCLVKIKTLTPRRIANTGQKKLTKALIKCSKSTETDEVWVREEENERDVFPRLNVLSKKERVAVGGCECCADCSLTNEDLLESSTSVHSGDDEGNDADGETEDSDDGEDDVVILSESNGVQNTINGFHDITYGSYLETHFKQVNRTGAQQRPSPIGNLPFDINIPQWNFMDPNLGSLAYPKFLCQFEDEHYLKSENIALLGLKLALGNNTRQSKFKF